ncbi:helix-turn-helix domain-containing protein [Paenibacillus sp. J5C_2022]|uniref:helix-turn-helix domain-containing protein n=1 Tax=Paenibacillus sp. J5C2022 TaxID=2977129 RepID=UPI0021D012DA|nr:helix-turn-helix domain-containing protein [Paenibacillus sp. J5C2022]MCU6710956.1 helix-turn-helix domain-containing protein [Paenibacillus sp. J5C2022]
MRKFQFRSVSKNSLLIRLLLSFAGIIVLLAAFQLISLSIIQDTIRKEVIKYNTMMLNKTIDSYETYFKLTDSMMTELFFDPLVNAIISNPGTNDHQLVNELSDRLKGFISNKQLYLNNILLYFPDEGIVFDMKGREKADKTFSRYYKSEIWKSHTWHQLSETTDHFTVHTASDFNTIQFANTVASHGTLFPITIKSKLSSFYIVAMVDANQIYDDYHFSINHAFYMINMNDKVLFHKHGGKEQEIPEAVQQKLRALDGISVQDYVKKDDIYYFSSQGELSGIRYVNVIPHTAIASQMTKINFILFGLLIVSIGFAVVISFVLSFRFYSPVQKIIESIQQKRQSAEPESTIHEFVLLHDNFTKFMKTDGSIRRELQHKNAILRNYGFMTKAKNIYANPTLQELAETNESFYLVLFDIMYTDQMYELMAEQQNRASYYINEFIFVHFAEHFPNASTFQIEEDRIMSLVFTSELFERLENTLNDIIRAIDRDNSYCVLTIAFDRKLHHAGELSSSFEIAINMLQQRRLTDRAQLITRYEPLTVTHVLEPAQERELFANLQAGNLKNSASALLRITEQLNKRNEIAYRYSRLALETFTIVIKVFISYAMDITLLLERLAPEKYIKKYATANSYAEYFEGLLDFAASQIEENRKEENPVVSYVIDYLHNRYHEDVSQEQLAEQLNISSSYLSVSFKEKTGKNFSEYLNELRIGRAKELLKHSSMKIQEVSSNIGYQNANSFIRMFKKVTGHTPGEYRRQLSD